MIDFHSLADRFRSPETRATALMGSWARGDADDYSDIDLALFESNQAENCDGQTHVVDGKLVVVSFLSPERIEAIFLAPELASESMRGLQTFRPLWDPEGYLDELQSRARDFVWDTTMQSKADKWASNALVGWAEEAHKGLGGLVSSHTGKLINARHGLSWGLMNVMCIQRGILISSDNSQYRDVVESLGKDSEWARLSEDVFGLTGLDLPSQVRAGLRLYSLTVAMLQGSIDPKCADVINDTVTLIRAALPE
ncbi:MAG: nucleotidyltransferase domain-containing protein [Gemmatimonadetes bacterium]|nr:nucleotidyltransferase domain-containing protein [Gemmatimonadota bacterium]MBT6149761.1 nucleotidyltransferase domain-containing protein [Gemmatimonadota bacterium]MBT7860247.1 nucleotidyltransferase domain-containing protein [Gemmatimonadota bacterium]